MKKGIEIIRQSLTVFILSVLIPVSVFATDYEYYVDPAATETGTGTLAQPYSTISEALTIFTTQNVVAGDTVVIYLLAGTYDVASEGEESQQLSVTSTVADSFTICAYGNGEVVLDGSGASSMTMISGLAVEGSGITIKGISFKRFTAGIYVSDESGATNVTISDNTFTDCNWGINFYPSSNGITAEVSGNTITGCYSGIAFTGSSTLVATVSENIFSVDAWDDGEPVAIWFPCETGDSVELIAEKNSFSYSGTATGYGLFGENNGGNLTLTLSKNFFSGFYMALYLNSASGNTSTTVVNNLICNPSKDTTDNPGYGLNIASASGETLIYHNTVDGGGEDMASVGIYLAGTSEESGTGVVKYNLVTNFADYGFQNDTTCPLTINAGDFEYNYTYGNETAYYGLDSVPTSTSVSLDTAPGYESDFSIPDDSPCVDKIPLSAYDYDTYIQNKISEGTFGDFMGTSRLRPASASGSEMSDIGAYEYPYKSYDFTMPTASEASSADYRLLTLPIDMAGVSVSEAFESLYGNYDTTTWRLFAYDTASAAYVELTSDAFDDFAARGRAFWAIASKAAFSDPVRSFEGNLVGDTEPFSMELSRGWNLISLPWPEADDNQYFYLSRLIVKGDGVEDSLTSEAQSLTDPVLWAYDPTGTNADENGYVKVDDDYDSLSVGTGYWLNVIAEKVTLIIPLFETVYMDQEKGKNSGTVKGSYEAPPSPPSAEISSAKGGSGCFIGAIGNTSLTAPFRLMIMFFLSGCLFLFKND